MLKKNPNFVSSRDPLWTAPETGPIISPDTETILKNLKKELGYKKYFTEENVLLSFRDLAVFTTTNADLENYFRINAKKIFDKIPGLSVTTSGVVIQKKDFLGKSVFVQIVEFLETNPDNEYTIKELADVLKQDSTMVRRVIYSSIKRKMILERRVNNQVLYKIYTKS